MRTTTPLAAIAILAAAIGTATVAANEERDGAAKPQQGELRPSGGYDAGMQVVPNAAGPQDRAYEWRYFSDPAAPRAVVISPQGDYYFSRGKGLRWVAAAPAQD